MKLTGQNSVKALLLTCFLFLPCSTPLWLCIYIYIYYIYIIYIYIYTHDYYTIYIYMIVHIYIYTWLYIYIYMIVYIYIHDYIYIYIYVIIYIYIHLIMHIHIYVKPINYIPCIFELYQIHIFWWRLTYLTAHSSPAAGNTPAGLAKKTGHREMEDVILEAGNLSNGHCGKPWLDLWESHG